MVLTFSQWCVSFNQYVGRTKLDIKTEVALSQNCCVQREYQVYCSENFTVLLCPAVLEVCYQLKNYGLCYLLCVLK